MKLEIKKGIIYCASNLPAPESVFEIHGLSEQLN
jgi:hypothetical protein